MLEHMLSALYRGPLQRDVQKVVGGPDILGQYELRVGIQFLKQTSYLLRIQSCWKTKWDYNTTKRLPRAGPGLPHPDALLPSGHPEMTAAGVHPQDAVLPEAAPARPGSSISSICRVPAPALPRCRPRRGRSVSHPRCSWRPAARLGNDSARGPPVGAGWLPGLLPKSPDLPLARRAPERGNGRGGGGGLRPRETGSVEGQNSLPRVAESAPVGPVAQLRGGRPGAGSPQAPS